METNKCPNCSCELPSNSNLCPACGFKIKENEPLNVQNSAVTEKSTRAIFAVVAAILAITALIVMITFRGWLGGLIFLVSVGICRFELNSDYEKNKSASFPEYIKECINGKNIFNKIMAIIIAVAPIALIIALILWFTIDTSRDVKDIYNNAADVYNDAINNWYK